MRKKRLYLHTSFEEHTSRRVVQNIANMQMYANGRIRHKKKQQNKAKTNSFQTWERIENGFAHVKRKKNNKSHVRDNSQEARLVIQFTWTTRRWLIAIYLKSW